MFDTVELLNKALDIEIDMNRFMEASMVEIDDFVIESLYANDIDDARL